MIYCPTYSFAPLFGEITIVEITILSGDDIVLPHCVFFVDCLLKIAASRDLEIGAIGNLNKNNGTVDLHKNVHIQWG